VLSQMAVGVCAIVLCTTLARKEPAPLGLRRRSLLLLVLPYAACGFFFFASESERWLFLLPIFFLWTAPAPARSPALGAAGVVILAIFNLTFGVLPLRDPRPAALVQTARSVLREGDLVLAPGHGWDEYLDVAEPLPKNSELLLLAFYAGRDGP